MLEDANKRKILAKWIIGIVMACCLIYLGLRHIASIAGAVGWLGNLLEPLLIGVILALVLNVPLSFIEGRLLRGMKHKKAKRPLAILLSLVLVIGIFIGVAFLVIPELAAAVKLIVQIISGTLDQMAQLESGTELSGTPLGQVLQRFDIDWSGLKVQLEAWFSSQGDQIIGGVAGAAGSIVGSIVTAVLALTFSIYILAQKETLKRQVSRLIRVWLPKRFGESLLHVASVCGSTFKLFIAGQATEAVILGTLCMIGMAILRIPYAPMIGALVGVTALIPIVGAWIGAIVGTVMILTVNPFKAFVFLVFLLILQQVEGNAIYPKVVGSKLKLPAIWVLAAITVGGGLAGPFGMLLGVPAASAAYSLLKEATDKRESAQLKIIPK